MVHVTSKCERQKSKAKMFTNSVVVFFFFQWDFPFFGRVFTNIWSSLDQPVRRCSELFPWWWYRWHFRGCVLQVNKMRDFWIIFPKTSRTNQQLSQGPDLPGTGCGDPLGRNGFRVQTRENSQANEGSQTSKNRREGWQDRCRGRGTRPSSRRRSCWGW